MRNTLNEEETEMLEGLYNIDLMKRLMETVDALVEDIQEEEAPIDTQGIVEFLAMKVNERVVTNTKKDEI